MPKQLISHVLYVEFYSPADALEKSVEIDVADPKAARDIGRQISAHLAKGCGYSVTSWTKDIKHVHIGKH